MPSAIDTRRMNFKTPQSTIKEHTSISMFEIFMYVTSLELALLKSKSTCIDLVQINLT